MATYIDSVRLLRERIEIVGDALREVSRVPRPDDDPVGPGIFRLRVEDADISALTLPGLSVSRSELSRVRFCDTELRLSAFHWADLVDCDFARSDLRQADLRNCRFVGCRFDGAVFDGADLRGSTFRGCTFTDARFEGALLQRGGPLSWLGFGRNQDSLPISLEQRSGIRWTSDAPEAPGG